MRLRYLISVLVVVACAIAFSAWGPDRPGGWLLLGLVVLGAALPELLALAARRGGRSHRSTG